MQINNQSGNEGDESNSAPQVDEMKQKEKEYLA